MRGFFPQVESLLAALAGETPRTVQICTTLLLIVRNWPAKIRPTWLACTPEDRPISVTDSPSTSRRSRRTEPKASICSSLGFMQICVAKYVQISKLVCAQSGPFQAVHTRDNGIGQAAIVRRVSTPVGGEGSVLSRALSPKGMTTISHFYVMDWASVWTDIAIGLLISGALAAWVPHGFWETLFLTHDPLGAKLIGPVIGPLVAVVSFVCSVGNVPLAAVLWNSGISFGGVVAFLFADLIILPILDIYRKYYGWRVALLLAMVFYAAIVLAGYAVEALFGAAGLVRAARHARIEMAQLAWNYTTVLNIIGLAVSALLGWRFLRTGGPDMLRMMSAPPDEHAAHHHA